MQRMTSNSISNVGLAFFRPSRYWSFSVALMLSSQFQVWHILSYIQIPPLQSLQLIDTRHKDMPNVLDRCLVSCKLQSDVYKPRPVFERSPAFAKLLHHVVQNVRDPGTSR